HQAHLGGAEQVVEADVVVVEVAQPGAGDEYRQQQHRGQETQHYCVPGFSAAAAASAAATSSWWTWLTRSRISLPGLKCGTCLAGMRTASPVLGLRPTRAGRLCNAKLPKPRISTRSCRASALLTWSRTSFTASSTSFCIRWVCLRERASISSDLVMARARLKRLIYLR